MSKLRQVLKLYCQQQNKLQVSTITGLSRNTVKKYIQTFLSLKTTWDEVSQLTDKDLDELFNEEPEPFLDDRLPLLHDFLKSQEKRLKQRGVTVLRLWEDYHALYPDGFRMTAFYCHYNLWKRRGHPSMHMEHKAGDKMFIDYTGEKLQVVDPESGEMKNMEVFVAILGASQLTYVEAVESQRVEDFIGCCENALHYFGGSPNAIVPDNLKSAVIKSNRYEPKLNENFEAFADYYGMAVRVPATSFAKNYMNISQVSVKEAGYIFVYLSYEDQSNNYVYFDDFKVTHTKSNLIQANEYYPFGMQTANTWTRENVTGNNFLANGGTELNATSSLYDLEFRNYDAVLGRMNQVDPMTHSLSSVTPYNYSFNNPVRLNDPAGDYPRGIPPPEICYACMRMTDNVMSSSGAGSNYWAQFRSMASNFWLMSSNDFQNYYGLDFNNNEDKARVGQNLAGTPDKNDFKYLAGFLHLTLGDLELGSNAAFITFIKPAKYSSTQGRLDDQHTFLSVIQFGTAWVKTADKISLIGGVQVGFMVDQSVDIAIRQYSTTQVRYLGPIEQANKLKGLEKISGYTKGASFGLTTIGVISSIAKFLNSDRSGEDWARLTGSGVIIGVNGIPTVGPAISFGLAVADASGYFDNFYKSFDDPTTRSLYLEGLLFNNPFIFTGNTFK